MHLLGAEVILEANAWFVAVAALALAGVFILFYRRTTRIETKLGTVESTAERIDQAVNCEPKHKPPIKVNAEKAAIHAEDGNRRLIAVETNLAALSEHSGETRRLARHALGKIAEVDAKLDRILERS